jgi:hypothetical protein
MSVFETTSFLLLWFMLVPAAAALVSDDIVHEKIGVTFTAWIDRKFRGSLIAYFARCPNCLSHWFVLIAAMALWRSWLGLPFKSSTLHVVFVACSILASIRITRKWLEK